MINKGINAVALDDEALEEVVGGNRPEQTNILVELFRLFGWL